QPALRPVASTAAPALKPAPRAPPPIKPAPPAAASNPTGRLKGLLNGVSDRATDSRSADVPAATVGPAVQASLGAEVKRQLKPHWKAPTGADADQLRTQVAISLAPNGQVTDIRIIGTTGQTASNRPQVPLHQEQAQRAVRLASPFRLPAEYYSAWKQLRVTFDKRLSQ
ncbi:MAG TPA: TonB C-terminal domain-containing protein, partial [Allosphingosinicella sp.]|nr:TonB C-terminal domain-containing protein [Allosphingosinicella sp.]